MRPSFLTVLQDLNLLNILARFQPTAIGTPPLGIDIESSDIDIACTASDLGDFESETENQLRHMHGFKISRTDGLACPAVIASFVACSWDIELFCQTIPVERQWGVRHFQVEKRLLELAPLIKPRIIHLKLSGMNTEAAFANVLGLRGDPFKAILALEDNTDRQLRMLVVSGLKSRQQHDPDAR